MTVNEAITAVLTASHIDDQNFRAFLRGDDPEVVAMRAALVQLADAVRDADEIPEPAATKQFWLGWDNSEPPQLWVWRGEPDESAEPWQRVIF